MKDSNSLVISTGTTVSVEIVDAYTLAAKLLYCTFCIHSVWYKDAHKMNGKLFCNICGRKIIHHAFGRNRKMV